MQRPSLLRQVGEEPQGWLPARADGAAAATAAVGGHWGILCLKRASAEPSRSFS